ncbi:Alcohol dehydrogenase superfamily, zinc-type, partial [Metarhizium majus ARSEF 297]
MTSNKAAYIKTRHAPVEVEATEVWVPGHGEVLVRNEAISFNPIDAKIQRLDLFQSTYPLVGGFTFAGTVVDVGPGVTSVQPGDRVAVARWGTAASENKSGAWQQYAIGLEKYLVKLAPETSLEVGSGVIANLATVISALTIHMGLSKPPVAGRSEPNGKRIFVYGGSSAVGGLARACGTAQGRAYPKPPVAGRSEPNGKRIFVYGGSSAVGGLAVKYASDAGYHVVTTSSPRNRELVEQRKAAHIVDHTQPREDLVKEILAHGPYDGVFDSIGTSEATQLMGELLRDTGGLFFSTAPTPEDNALPTNVQKKWAGYSDILVSETANQDLRDWYLRSYLPAALKSGEVWPNPAVKLEGGLGSVQRALDLMFDGKVSGSKLVVNPWD